MSDQSNVTKDVFADFKNRVNTISTDRVDWQSTLFSSANEALYKMLGDIYTLYDESKEGNDLDEKKYDWLLEECQKKKLPLNKKPTLIQLLVKYVFSDNDTDSRRISSYARVLSVAAQSSAVQTGKDVPKFIKKYGGIEEIRAALAKNTKTPNERAEVGRGLALERKNICEVETDITKTFATKAKGQVVLLVGFVNPQGNVDVKHVCFENDVSKFNVGAKTAINAALSNLYSQTEKMGKAEAEQKAAEKATDDKNKKALEAVDSVAEEQVSETKMAA